MASYIQNKFESILGDGARATKFDANIVFNNDLYSDDEAVSFLIKSMDYPSKSHTTVDFKYKGRSIPLKGQTKYNQTWTCTFYLTPDHKLRNVFETWIESLDQQHNYFEDVSEIKGLKATQEGNESSYVTDLFLYQRNFDDDQNTAVYHLYNALPIEISTMQANSESIGEILEFTVTFAYSHYKSEVMKGADNNFIDEMVDKFKNVTSNAFNTAKNSLNENISSFIKSGTGSFDETKKSIMGSVDKMESSILDYLE